MTRPAKPSLPTSLRHRPPLELQGGELRPWGSRSVATRQGRSQPRAANAGPGGRGPRGGPPWNFSDCLARRLKRSPYWPMPVPIVRHGHNTGIGAVTAEIHRPRAGASVSRHPAALSQARHRSEGHPSGDLEAPREIRPGKSATFRPGSTGAVEQGATSPQSSLDLKAALEGATRQRTRPPTCTHALHAPANRRRKIPPPPGQEACRGQAEEAQVHRAVSTAEASGTREGRFRELHA